MAGWYEGEPEAAVITQSPAADIGTALVAGKVVRRDGSLPAENWDQRCADMDGTKRRFADRARQADGCLIPDPPPALPEGHGW